MDPDVPIREMPRAQTAEIDGGQSHPYKYIDETERLQYVELIGCSIERLIRCGQPALAFLRLDQGLKALAVDNLKAFLIRFALHTCREQRRAPVASRLWDMVMLVWFRSFHIKIRVPLGFVPVFFGSAEQCLESLVRSASQ